MQKTNESFVITWQTSCLCTGLRGCEILNVLKINSKFQLGENRREMHTESQEHHNAHQSGLFPRLLQISWEQPGAKAVHNKCAETSLIQVRWQAKLRSRIGAWCCEVQSEFPSIIEIERREHVQRKKVQVGCSEHSKPSVLFLISPNTKPHLKECIEENQCL